MGFVPTICEIPVTILHLLHCPTSHTSPFVVTFASGALWLGVLGISVPGGPQYLPQTRMAIATYIVALESANSALHEGKGRCKTPCVSKFPNDKKTQMHKIIIY